MLAAPKSPRGARQRSPSPNPMMCVSKRRASSFNGKNEPKTPGSVWSEQVGWYSFESICIFILRLETTQKYVNLFHKFSKSKALF